MATAAIDLARHPLADGAYVEECRERLDATGALVLVGFFTAETIERLVAESAGREPEAFYAASTHNVYLTEPAADLADDHPFNRQVASSKGLLADDQIPADSPLREIYADPVFRRFLCGVLGVPAIHPYADDLSSINVHFADAGRELGWHFDNSSFAVTILLQKPEGGGRFEYVPDVRDADTGEMGFAAVGQVLDGTATPKILEFDPGALVLFRGRNSLHRVTPTVGEVTRLLAVFAYNDRPGVKLSDSALRTFFGRAG